VIDQTGAVLPGVTIDLVTSQAEMIAVSDGSGLYRFERVPVGSAELTFRLINFTVLRRTLAVADGQSVTADVILQLSLSADVIVTGKSTFRNIAEIENPAENLVGIASAASQGAITAAQLEVRPVMRAGELLETVPGMVVVYRFSVTSDTPVNSGEGSEGLLSPKFAAVFGPWVGTDIYASAGMGFHSNDARGATISVDPATGEPANRVTPLVRAKGAELGIRTVRVRGLQSTFSLWYLGLDSELVFVGDAGTTEAGRPSRRVGLEWTNYWRLRPWLASDADLSFSRARFANGNPAGRYIPGALDRVLAAGVTVEPRQPIFGSIRVRHFGPRPLIEDASVKSTSTTLWNGELGYRVYDKARVVLELFNVFDGTVSDIDYYYASRLPGEPQGGIEDIHTHPALPRSARIGLQLSF
jgi:hypothetical protein